MKWLGFRWEILVQKRRLEDLNQLRTSDYLGSVGTFLSQKNIIETTKTLIKNCGSDLLLCKEGEVDSNMLLDFKLDDFNVINTHI